MIPAGLCQCGCGEAAPIAKRTHKRSGHVKGEPVRFVKGHHLHGRHHPRWKGGRIVRNDGYVLIHMPEHPRADTNHGYVYEHILVAEQALGKPLPPGAEVHHVDVDCGNNEGTNLVICQDDAYHKLLHQRMRALRACGHADWLKCKFCKQYDAPENLYVSPCGSVHHPRCVNEYHRNRRKKSVESQLAEVA